ncbi:CAI-1 autoinducer sensor kinase/phosphatase CqsS [Anatilimnocola aggregata]|uniref:CAI-1 autoinducer sensor kinase/phosphatase CqsS n=1 Tax=Anatilimnocola aggregata TaxID=2528021 RepID=A0A517YME7_9BACT|nr:response regulator [Anatilimnocola aggregata]QDU31393.1 CAI-1 autoinducer sensor kinase/phosphatase CqsS [Anatilimnocola aggregata]
MSDTFESHTPLRILVVEDNKDAADSLAMLLRIQCAHSVDVAYTGLQALQIANIRRPDVILLDLGLPIMNGYQVAEAVRAMPDAEEIVIIAITGHSQPEAVDASAAAGIDLHLAKPVDIRRLLSYLSGRGLS